MMVKEAFIHEVDSSYEHLKRQFQMTNEGTLEKANPRYIEKLLDWCGENGERVVTIQTRNRVHLWDQ